MKKARCQRMRLCSRHSHDRDRPFAGRRRYRSDRVIRIHLLRKDDHAPFRLDTFRFGAHVRIVRQRKMNDLAL